MPIIQEELDEVGLMVIEHTVANAENIITLQNADNEVRAIYYKFYVGLNLTLKVICNITDGRDLDVESAYWLDEEDCKDEIDGLTE